MSVIVSEGPFSVYAEDIVQQVYPEGAHFPLMEEASLATFSLVLVYFANNNISSYWRYPITARYLMQWFIDDGFMEYVESEGFVRLTDLGVLHCASLLEGRDGVIPDLESSDP